MPRRYIVKDNGYTCDVEEFKDFNELLRVVDQREENSWASYHSGGKHDGNDSWCGGSYEEAKDLLLHGWDDKVEEIKKKYTEYTKALDAQRPKQYTSRVGYTPNVPNAIKGLPNSMFNTKLEPKKTKVIDVMVDLGVAGSVDVDRVIKRSVEVLAKISSLEQSGYRVRITFLKSFNNGRKKSYCCKLVVKNEFQPLDIKRVAFPLGHPAMFRRIMFDWYMRLPDAEEFDGFGYSLGYTDYDQRGEVVKMLSGKNQYVIHYKTDLDELFQSLR